MGRRSVLPKYQVFSNADSSTDPVSTETDIQGVDSVVYTIDVDPTVNATMNIKYCNDVRFDPDVSHSLNFEQVLSLNGSTDTSYQVVIENRGFKWTFIEVENSGGTGNINAWVSGTVKGA
jgi:hypothetical protein